MITSLELWKEQIGLICRKKTDLASFIVHPDYVIEQKARRVYRRVVDILMRELRWQTQNLVRASRGDRTVGGELGTECVSWANRANGELKAKVLSVPNLPSLILVGDRLEYVI